MMASGVLFMNRRTTVTLAASIVLLASIFILSMTSTAADVSGPISTDTTWTLAMSPINLTKNVTIEADQVLTIEAGVVVRFTEGTCLYIDGNLSVEGNMTDPVWFVSNASSPAPGDYVGIILNQTGTLDASYLNVSNASTALKVDGSINATLDHFSSYNNNMAINVTSMGYAEVIDSDSNIAAESYNGTLYFKNTIVVKAIYEHNMTPIKDIDVQVSDDKGIIYSTPGYASGPDPATDIDGLTLPIITGYKHIDDGVLTPDYVSIFCKLTDLGEIWNAGLSGADTSTPATITIPFDVIPPDAPTNLTAFNVTGTTVQLDWDPATDPGCDGYTVYLSTNNATSGFYQYAGTTLTEITLFSLTSETTYWIAVEALDCAQNPSVFSNVVEITTLDITAPEPPTNLSVGEVGGTFVELEWISSVSTDIKFYRVFLNSTVPGTFSNIATFNATVTNATLHGLSSETEYTFYLDATDMALTPNNSTRSNYVTTTTLDITSPEMPNLGESLPDITNIPAIAVRGQVPGETYCTVVIHNDVKGYFNTTTDATGVFNRSISFAEGSNVISIHAIDLAGNPSAALTHTLVLDTAAPVAMAGNDIDTTVGSIIEFNGTGSTDNNGVASYSWSFVYNGTTMNFYTPTFSYQFDYEKDVLVELTVQDSAGNTAKDSMWVNVTMLDLVAPQMTANTPTGSGNDKNGTTTITATLDEEIDPASIQMNVTSDSGTVVTGTVSYATPTVTFTITDQLEGNTTYIIDLTVMDMSGNLANFTWTFKTAADPSSGNGSDGGGIIDVDGEDGDDGEDNETLKWVLIGVAAVLLIGVIVLTVFLYMKSSGKDKLQEADKAEDYEDEDGEGHLFKCPECSAELAEGITYCYECGAEIEEEDEDEDDEDKDEDEEEYDDDEDDEEEDDEDDEDEDEEEEDEEEYEDDEDEEEEDDEEEDEDDDEEEVEEED